jgi:hypothetical protein
MRHAQTPSPYAKTPHELVNLRVHRSGRVRHRTVQSLFPFWTQLLRSRPLWLPAASEGVSTCPRRPCAPVSMRTSSASSRAQGVGTSRFLCRPRATRAAQHPARCQVLSTSTEVQFSKYQGLGNDFILVRCRFFCRRPSGASRAVAAH